VELKLHIEVMPVSDVDRAKDFYKLAPCVLGRLEKPSGIVCDANFDASGVRRDRVDIVTRRMPHVAYGTVHCIVHGSGVMVSPGSTVRQTDRPSVQEIS
jgi:hypothetical protein